MIKIFRTSDGKCLQTSANKILRYNVPDITYANSKYGLLYNTYAIEDSKNICPVGWHIPTSSEWATLGTYLGGDSGAGIKLKESGLTWWGSPNTGATNETGFNGRGSGYRNIDGTFTNFGGDVYYACSDGWDVYNYYRRLSSSLNQIYGAGSGIPKKRGSSIRLIKDDSTDSGTMVGTDNLTYRTVKIGSQVWMAENYQSKKYRDGSDIPNVTDNTTWAGLTTGAWCAYDNNLNNV